MDLTNFTGTGAFGRAYRIMMQRDSHAAGSVDRVLAANMIRLCHETADHLYTSFSPLEVPYSRGSRPELEGILNSTCSGGADRQQRLSEIVGFTSTLGAGAEKDLAKMRTGGTEEDIIKRKSDWCTDVARAACVLCQIAGFPCRIVNLFNLHQAYSGHVIVEAYRAGRWGALDSSTGVVYQAADGGAASVWGLMNDPELIDRHREATGGFYTSRDQFSAAGIANYFLWEHERYDYTVSGVNDYYLSILSMSDEGWPGGLRWLHGEDTNHDEQTPADDVPKAVPEE